MDHNNVYHRFRQKDTPTVHILSKIQQLTGNAYLHFLMMTFWIGLQSCNISDMIWQNGSVTWCHLLMQKLIASDVAYKDTCDFLILNCSID